MILSKLVKKTLIFLVAMLPLAAFSQDVDCRIQINASQLQLSDKTIFEELQKQLFEFINQRNWTNNVYTLEERIECNIQLNITSRISSDEFKGQIQVTSSRPVYNTGYKSPILNILDKSVQFRYAKGQTLELAENSHNELTALISFYIYMVIGLDYDTFSPLGGAEYFAKAEKIVNTAQSSPYVGWKSYESQKNRYWFVENYVNSAYSAIREYSYTYHRQGLDIMSEKAANGRTTIIEGLTNLLKVHRQKPSSYIMQMFFEAKTDEFVNVITEAPSNEAIRAVNILKEIDPANKDKYEKAIKKQ